MNKSNIKTLHLFFDENSEEYQKMQKRKKDLGLKTNKSYVQHLIANDINAK